MQLLALGAVLAAGLLSAQAKPNFSGTWTLASSDSPGTAAGVKAVVIVLSQTDRTLTLENSDQTLLFPLDGSETAMKVPGPAGPRDLKLSTRWAGAQLVVEQRTAIASINTTLALSDDGNELTVETVAQTPQGEGRERQVFKQSRRPATNFCRCPRHGAVVLPPSGVVRVASSYDSAVRHARRLPCL